MNYISSIFIWLVGLSFTVSGVIGIFVPVYEQESRQYNCQIAIAAIFFGLYILRSQLKQKAIGRNGIEVPKYTFFRALTNSNESLIKKWIKTVSVCFFGLLVLNMNLILKDDKFEIGEFLIVLGMYIFIVLMEALIMGSIFFGIWYFINRKR